MAERPERALKIGRIEVRVSEAWRGRGGHGLLYFRAPDDGAGETDRRAPLGPEESLAALSDEQLRERYEAGSGLTVTERRFRAPDGRLWLVQSAGPVWAQEGSAAGLTELLFTSLEGERERFSVPEGQAGGLDPGGLASAWRRGRPSDG